MVNADAYALWVTGFGHRSSRLDLPLGEMVDGPPLHRARPIPVQGGPEDPGRVKKDWNYYRFRPYDSSLTCVLNKTTHDARWPGEQITVSPRAGRNVSTEPSVRVRRAKRPPADA